MAHAIVNPDGLHNPVPFGQGRSANVQHASLYMT
jgi:hypothetical protein